MKHNHDEAARYLDGSSLLDPNESRVELRNINNLSELSINDSQMEDFNFKKREHFWSYLTCTCSSSTFQSLCSRPEGCQGPVPSPVTSLPLRYFCFGSSLPPSLLNHSYFELLEFHSCLHVVPWHCCFSIDCSHSSYSSIHESELLRKDVAFCLRFCLAVSQAAEMEYFNYPCFRP